MIKLCMLLILALVVHFILLVLMLVVLKVHFILLVLVLVVLKVHFILLVRVLVVLTVLLQIVWMLDLGLIKKGHSRSSYNSKKA